ncbi:hypothetical protein MSKOL_2656 [Methanosarcina sp. Kolksee]|nr:hypothetical protein MSKOL_2656 [Methanosarcina sp. Kolksee]
MPSQITIDAVMALKISFFQVLATILEKQSFFPQSSQRRVCSAGRFEKRAYFERGYIKESRGLKKRSDLRS